MARNFSGTTQSLTQGDVSGSRVNTLSAGSVSGWFKSSDAGTTRIVIYSESNNSSLINLFIAINDGTNGQIRVFRRDASSNQVSMTYNGSLADDAWHHFAYVWRSLLDHELFVDGVSRATSTTNLAGTLTGTGYGQAIGRREIPTGTATGYFIGDIADVALWGDDLTLAEAAAMFGKTEHPMGLRSAGDAQISTDLRSYWTLAAGAILNDDDLRDQKNLQRAALTKVGSPASASGPDGDGPTAMVATTDVSKAWVWTGLQSGAAFITRGASAGDQDRLIREIGNVRHNPGATSGWEYLFVYAGSDDPYNGGDVAILGARASTLGGSWTKTGALIPNATLPGEDPWIYRDPATGTEHCWFENKTGGDNANGIAHFTSSDGGQTWSLENATAIDNGTAGAWDETDVSSPIVWKEGSTWYMLYEGRSGAGTDGSIGLATASSPNGPWTKSGSNPVMTPTAPTAWDDQAIVPDHLVKIGPTYWLVYHGTPDGLTYRLGLAYSTNLTTWTKATINPITTDRWAGHHLQAFGDDFDVFLCVYQNEVYKVQLWGDAAAQQNEWPAAVQAPPLRRQPARHLLIR